MSLRRFHLARCGERLLPSSRETSTDEEFPRVSAVHRHRCQRPPKTIVALPDHLDATSREEGAKRIASGISRREVAPCIAAATILAFRRVREFGGIDVRDPHSLATAADRVAVVNGEGRAGGANGRSEDHGR